MQRAVDVDGVGVVRAGGGRRAVGVILAAALASMMPASVRTGDDPPKGPARGDERRPEPGVASKGRDLIKSVGSAGYLILGALADDMGQAGTALADLDEAIRLDPYNAYTRRSRGKEWRRRGAHDKALADLDEAIRLEPRYAGAYAERSVVRAEMKEYDRAIADVSEVIRLDPQYAGAWGPAQRGHVRRLKGDHDNAIADYSEALRLDSRYVWAYRERALACEGKQAFDGTIADCTEIIRLAPKDAWAHTERGYVWAEKGLYDKALADLDEAVRLDPGDSWARAERGYSWWKTGQYEKAVADYSEAIRLDPKDAWTHGKRAWLWATCPEARFRDGKRAVESVTRACELTEWKDADHIDTLAAACAEASDFDAAVKWQAKANAMFTEAEWKAEGEARLKLYRAGSPYREEKPR